MNGLEPEAHTDEIMEYSPSKDRSLHQSLLLRHRAPFPDGTSFGYSYFVTAGMRSLERCTSVFVMVVDLDQPILDFGEPHSIAGSAEALFVEDSTWWYVESERAFYGKPVSASSGSSTLSRSVQASGDI